jgi:hypothetical protein
MGQAVQVIRSAIKRVNNPAAGRVFAFDFVAFFTQPAIVRTRFGQFFADQFFGLKVGFGNKVPGACRFSTSPKSRIRDRPALRAALIMMFRFALAWAIGRPLKC